MSYLNGNPTPFEEWEFQNAEGIETYSRRTMLEKAFNDGVGFGKKEATEELQAQIEKMKCCYNCKHSRTEYEHCKTDKHEKWEIKEK